MPEPSTSDRIRAKLSAALFDQKLIQNNLRGIWMEYVVAEALGANFRLVGQDWHAWDIEWGEQKAKYPDRVRIQVKNTSRTQTWGKKLQLYTDCQWTISLRNRPSYFDKYNPEIPCEQYGFHCELFVLCHHPEEDWCLADHRDLAQWDFYLLPVTRDHSIYPIQHVNPHKPQDPKSFTVVPKSLAQGIRKRPCIEPVKFDELTEEFIFHCLASWRLPPEQN
jgi:hypothetical protein